MLDFRIQTFLSVCRHMSFTAAAEELHITQPTVSHHIQHLEQLYGVALFYREGKKIALTAPGNILKQTAMTLQNDQQAMIRRMHESIHQKRTLLFGVTLTIGEYAIVPALSRYLKHHPDTDLTIRYGNTHQLLDRLRQGEIDFALVEGYFASQEFETMVDRSEPYIPVCAAGHQFSREVHTIHDLLDERLLVREEGSGTREILEKNLAVHNLHLSQFAHLTQVGNVHTIVRLLVQDCGISFLFQAAVAQELKDGLIREIPLDGFHLSHDFTFLWNRNSCYSEDYRKICTELRSTPGI